MTMIDIHKSKLLACHTALLPIGYHRVRALHEDLRETSLFKMQKIEQWNHLQLCNFVGTLQMPWLIMYGAFSSHFCGLAHPVHVSNLIVRSLDFRVFL